MVHAVNGGQAATGGKSASMIAASFGSLLGVKKPVGDGLQNGFDRLGLRPRREEPMRGPHLLRQA
jgi:hypothetical protein